MDIDLLDPEIQKYITLKLEASPTIQGLYSSTIKPGNFNSSYSKFSDIVASAEVESCKDIIDKNASQEELAHILGLRLDPKNNRTYYDEESSRYCFNTSKLHGIGVELWEEEVE